MIRINKRPRSRSGGDRDAREAMTVGCKPTIFRGWVGVRVLGYGFGVRGRKVNRVNIF